MATTQTPQTKHEEQKARADHYESRVRLLTALVGLVAAIATALGIVWQVTVKQADTAAGKANASSLEARDLQVEVKRLQREKADLQRQLAAEEKTPDETNPSANATSGTGSVYLDQLSPVQSDFSPTVVTVRGVSQKHALATPLGCAHADEPTAEYNILDTKLTRFRAIVMLDDEVSDGKVLKYFVHINGELVQKGDVKYGDPVKINRPVAEAKRVTFGFVQEFCPENRGQGIWADVQLSVS